MASTFAAWRALVLMLVLSPLVPATAQACSVIVDRERSDAERRRAARHAVDAASAIVDGEVVRPFSGRQPALVRAVRVLKGAPPSLFEVGVRDSCDTALIETGARMRLVLDGGPDLYFIPYPSAEDRYVDRLLRSDRRRDWPYRGGAVSPAR